MFQLIWLIPVLPFVGFLILALCGTRLPRRIVPFVGAGSVGLSAIVALSVAARFLSAPPESGAYSQTLGTWMHVGGFRPEFALYLDALSLVMVLVVTVVGFLIHLYSAGFMHDDDGYSRFFAYMNLFVGMMLALLLADNLVLLYLGWEGVGLCSYLLIGFWYADPANGRAARKAFVVTRVGDAAMAVGLFLLFHHLGTLQIQPLMQQAAIHWPTGTPLAVAAAALLLAGAVGKSAQLPLQVWLPDAMAGPTPVSALIHAATMVTAGVYLIARTHVLFALAPPVQVTVGIIGTLTLLLAGFSALVQRDIKRVLAYSTISQIGYMFVALGVGAWSAALFHFMTHAFFKALLFLGAGVLIYRLHHEHDMFKMGGLRKHLPVTFWTFLIGAASLASLPLVTAGFYSKDRILELAWTSQMGSVWLWLGGIVGALVTAVYSFRMVFVTFFGEPGPLVEESAPIREPGWSMRIPLIVLAVLSVIGGFVEFPETWGGGARFSAFLETALPAPSVEHAASATETTLQLVAALAAVGGLVIAWGLFLWKRDIVAGWAATSLGEKLGRLWFIGWGFDRVYNRLFVQPYNWLATANRQDIVDRIPDELARISRDGHRMLSRTETGRVRLYAAGIAVGVVIAVGLTLFW